MRPLHALARAALVLTLTVSLGACGAGAADPDAGLPIVSDAWVRPPVGPERPAAGYLTITNPCVDADALLGASSPVAASVQIHQSMTEYAPRADANGFAVVYPQALGSPAAWNLSATSPDITFVTQVLDEIEASMCIDTNRVFISGFSLGAFLTSLLMCGPLSERVAAVAPVAGCEFHRRARGVVAFEQARRLEDARCGRPSFDGANHRLDLGNRHEPRAQQARRPDQPQHRRFDAARRRAAVEDGLDAFAQPFHDVFGPRRRQLPGAVGTGCREWHRGLAQ